MGIGTGRCCVKCKTYLAPLKNDIVVLETFEDHRPYKLWCADLFICPGCKYRLISGFGQEAISEHYMPDFDEIMHKYFMAGILFTINGCPVRLDTWDGETN